jgi:hypothetical protein
MFRGRHVLRVTLDLYANNGRVANALRLMKSLITIGLVAFTLLLLSNACRQFHADGQAQMVTPQSHDARSVDDARSTAWIGGHGQRSALVNEVTAMDSTVADADAGRFLDWETPESFAEHGSDHDIPAVMDSFTDDSSETFLEMQQRLIRSWAESDPAAAAEWVAQIPEGPLRLALLEQVAIEWGNLNLAAAAAWALDLPEGGSKEAAITGLAYEAARTEPVAALTLAAALPATPDRDELLVHAVSQWAATDPIAAGAWSLVVPESVLQQRLTAAVAVAFAEQEPVAAGSLAVTALDPGDEQDSAIVAIVQRWAQSSPEEASSWVAQFPDLAMSEEAVRHLVPLWLVQDPDATALWLSGLTDGPIRDAGIAAYADAVIRLDAPAGGSGLDSVEAVD